MKFEALRHRVKRAEKVVSIRVDETQCNWFTLSQAWREGWTPLRIVSVGLVGGFIAGKLEPGKTRFHGARWLQMIGSVSNLMASAQAAFASMQLLNPGNPKANRFVLGASGHIAGVINPASKNKRSHWINDKGGKSRPRTDSAWFESAAEHKGSWWPEWAKFLAENGGAQVPAPAAAGSSDYPPSEPAPGRYVQVRAD